MIERKVMQDVYRADIKKLEQAHEYALNIKNLTAERCYIARELFKSVLDSVTITKEERTERIRETEEQAKAYFGEEFVEKLQSIINYCGENNLALQLHGTSEDYIPEILNNGLSCHTNDIAYTSLSADRKNLYSDLLNWPHREYKGIILLALPKECIGITGHGEQPIWNDSTIWANGYELAPEFILGALDIENKSIIMNNAFTKDHDYSKFRLKNCEIDDMEHSNAVENDIPIDPAVFDLFEGKSVDLSTLPNPEDLTSIAPNNWIDNDEEISSDNPSVINITEPLDNEIHEHTAIYPEDSISIAPNNWIDNDEEISLDNTTITDITTSLDNAIFEMKNEERIFYHTPHADRALDAITR